MKKYSRESIMMSVIIVPREMFRKQLLYQMICYSDAKFGKNLIFSVCD